MATPTSVMKRKASSPFRFENNNSSSFGDSEVTKSFYLGKTTSGPVLSDFNAYCIEIKVKPSQATPKTVVKYVASVLQSTFPERRQLVKESSFVNIGERISSILCKSLAKDSFLDSPEINGLKTTLLACDQMLTSDATALKLLPEYNYVRCISEQMKPSDYWSQDLVRNALIDLRRELIPINVVAMELGVTVEMLYFAMHKNDPLKKDELPSLREFEKMEEAANTSFWDFPKIKPFLNGVRDTKLQANEVSVHFGVSRKKIMLRCGGVKSKEELDAETELFRMKRLEAREESFMSRLENTDLDKQIRYAKRNEANLCEYEKKRLENLEDRKMLLQSLDFMEDKLEIRRLNQVIRTPEESNNSEKLPKREKSARIKRQAENKRLQNLGSASPSIYQRNQKPVKKTPYWFGTTFSQTSKLKVLDQKCVPKVSLKAAELLEITKDYRKSRIFLDSVSDECKELKAETVYNDVTDWRLLTRDEEFIVSSSRVTKIDTHGDFITYGTEEGGVGVQVAGRSLTLRPHAGAVSGLVTSGARILSAGRDGTVRNTDLESQVVSLEYSWDMCSDEGEGRHGVLGMVQRADYSYILHCSDKIVNLDVRQREAKKLAILSDTISSTLSNIRMNPVRENLFTTSNSDTVVIWDLRKMPEPVWTLNVGGDVSFCGWNSTENDFAITTNDGAWVYDFVNGVPNNNFRISLKFSNSGFKRLEGDLWCPWPGQESTLFNITFQSLRGLRTQRSKLSGINTKRYVVFCY